MPKIIGPNGLTIEVSDVTAEGLLRSKGEYVLVGVEKPDPAAKKAEWVEYATELGIDVTDLTRDQIVEKPDPAAKKAEWVEYATELGIDVTDLTRDQIVEKVAEHEASSSDDS